MVAQSRSHSRVSATGSNRGGAGGRDLEDETNPHQPYPHLVTLEKQIDVEITLQHSVTPAVIGGIANGECEATTDDDDLVWATNVDDENHDDYDDGGDLAAVHSTSLVPSSLSSEVVRIDDITHSQQLAEITQFLTHGHDKMEPRLQYLLRDFQIRQLKGLREKMRIHLGDSGYFVGVPDPCGVLAEGQVCLLLYQPSRGECVIPLSVNCTRHLSSWYR